MLACLFALGIILCIIHCYFKYNKNTRLLRKIPGPNENFLVGNAFGILVSSVEVFNLARYYANKFKDLYSWWAFLTRVVNIYNPEDIEIVLSRSKHTEKGKLYKFLKTWLRDGLLLSSGPKWQNRRKLLTTAFHFNILRQFHSTLEDNSRRLVNSLVKTTGQSVNIVPVLSSYTLSSICETAMGYRLDNQKKCEGKYYNEAVHELGKMCYSRFSKVYFHSDFIFNLSALGRKTRKHLNTAHSFTKRVIHERKQFVTKHGIQVIGTADQNNDDVIFLNNKKKRVAMLDLLISAEKEGAIDDKGVQEEVDTFMFEAHDTTASGLTYLIMSLANHKNEQDKVVAELNEVFADSTRRATIEDLSEMRYLECCIKESLRLHPPVPLIGRLLSEDVKLSNYAVPAGTECLIHIFDLHRRADLYENPLVFDPDRFLPENCVGRHPYAYIPFSAGPRNCIGQKFAMVEMKSCIAAVLRKFEVQPVTRTEDLEYIGDMILRDIGHVYVKFTERPSFKKAD